MASRSAQEKEWRTQSDLETLSRAAEIQNDRTRMTAVQKHAAKQVANLNKVAAPAKAKAPAKKRGK
ncbi:hypothetical protein [Methylobacterium sp. WL120]|uniref:hypothetical protein n=1 Tax=Methylobacterium sp. WL120 TaxID=2603887 RepID=UPI0011C95D51|nr:hypothetical protein [Methylobacterium sp. WL120]TXM68178.1 hypothetical protein FV229_08360 [Methylobacterium sp. WL120]